MMDTSSRSSCILALVAAVDLSLGATASSASTYEFVSVADTTGAFSSFASPTTGLNPPSINGSGVVAFTAGLDAGGEGVFTSTGGLIDTIIDTSAPFDRFGGRPSINNNGTVAFHAAFDGGGEGIFTSSGGPTTTIVDNSTTFAFFGNPTLNDAGTVAFFAAYPDATGNDPFDNPGGVFTGDGSALPITVADSSGPMHRFAIYPSINNSGAVAFAASFDGGGGGIFTDHGGAITTIADSSGPLNLLGTPSISTSGAVAFTAFIDSGGLGLFVGSGGAVDTIADSSGPFSSFGPAKIDFDGTIAFYASLDAGGFGIFTGDDPVADKVIVSGDPLFGSTATGLGVSFTDMYSNGRIAFTYRLASGIEGIAIARVVPEPASLAHWTIAGAALTARRRTRRRREVRR